MSYKKIMFLATFLFSLIAFGDNHNDLYKLSFRDLNDNEVKMKEMKGKVLLVVNTASRCGYTPQFEQLQELYKAYKDKGLEVIGFPSNDFRQEDMDGKKLAKFCKLNYGVTFTMASRSSVIGENKNPIYQYLVENSETKKDVRWNFEKFLVGKDGKVIARFSSAVAPNDKRLLEPLKAAL